MPTFGPNSTSDGVRETGYAQPTSPWERAIGAPPYMNQPPVTINLDTMNDEHTQKLGEAQNAERDRPAVHVTAKLDLYHDPPEALSEEGVYERLKDDYQEALVTAIANEHVHMRRVLQVLLLRGAITDEELADAHENAKLLK